MNKRQLTKMSLLLFIGYVNLNALHKELGHLTDEQKSLAKILTLITPEAEAMYKKIVPENEIVNQLFGKFEKKPIVFAYKKQEPKQKNTDTCLHSQESFFKTNILGALDGSYSITFPLLDK